MQQRCVAAVVVAACLVYAGAALASECPGNPQALGTARTITIDPTEHARIGSMQYDETLPLADKEVVITFDDGPLPAYTSRILDTLASECVKATFFMVGQMARAYPEWVRRVYNAGHTVATHSNSHPRYFRRLSHERAVAEIENGIAAVETALGDERALAPFFRFPGLGNSREIERYLAGRKLMTWSADFPADDWTHISSDQVRARALDRLERKGRGVLLLHDIQPATALALPGLLRELKARGYRIVHVVPAGPERPKTVTEPQAWAFHQPRRPTWPMVLPKNLDAPPVLSTPSTLSFGFPHPLAETVSIGSFDGERPAMIVRSAAVEPMTAAARRSGRTAWPPVAGAATMPGADDALPAPASASPNPPAIFGGRPFTPEEGGGPRAAAKSASRVAAVPERRVRTRIRAAALRPEAAAAEPAPGPLARLFPWFHTQQ